MAIYTSLPGIQTELKDGGLILPANNRTTRRVLVIAPTSTTVNVSLPADLSDLDVTPKKIKSSGDFENFNLGRYSKSNPLARLWKQVYDAGISDVFCLPLPGVDARERYIALHTIYSVLEDNFATDLVVVGGGNPEGDNPWGVYTDTKIEERDYQVVKAAYTLTAYEAAKENTASPEGQKINGLVDLTLSGRADYIATKKYDKAITTQLIEADILAADIMTQAADKAGVIKLPYSCLAGTLTVGKKSAAAPVDGEAKEIAMIASDKWHYDAVDGTVHLDTELTFAEGEIVVVSYETFELNFGDQLASLCFEVSRKNNQLLGFMSVTPLKLEDTANLMKVKRYIDGLKQVTFNAYLQVIAGPSLLFEVNNEPYEDSWVGAYAGMVAFLPSYSATTSKSIPGYLSASYNLSATQVLKLVNKHYVVPRTKNGRLVVSDGITTAKAGSDFVRLSTIRITNDAIEMARGAAEGYIGEPNTLPRRNALETQVNTGLKGMIQAGALNDGRATVSATTKDEIDGTMRVFLELVPAFETRTIAFSVALKPTIERE